MFPLLVLIGGIVNKDMILNKGEQFYEKWGSFYYEFDFKGSFMKTNYYFVFLTRRLIFILNLVFMRDYPIVQGSINILISLFVIFI